MHTPMTLERAVAMLSESKSVREWNNTREYIKSQMDAETWLTGFFPTIDTSGLIVRVLGTEQK